MNRTSIHCAAMSQSGVVSANFTRRYLRRLLRVGATAVLRMARQRSSGGPWIQGLLERKKPKAAAVALANKTARIAWMLMARKQIYAPPARA